MSFSSLPPARKRSVLLIGVASVLEKCEEQVLPALYSRVGAAFSATPAQLGYLTLGRALMQALASPAPALAARLAPRGAVIAAGCGLWAVCTAAFAATGSLAAAAPFVALNGAGLALVIPSVQSLTADYFPAGERGRAFGALWLAISSGGMAGALFATNVGGTRPLGVDGWRFVFLATAAVSAVAGVLNFYFVEDPTFGGGGAAQQDGAPLAPAGAPAAAAAAPPPPRLDAALLRSVGRDVRAVLRVPSFVVIVAQGIIGSVPYASLVFLTLLFQLRGMSDAAAAGLVAAFLLFGGLGGLLGGAVGDAAGRAWPNHGRIVATQASVAVGLPFAWLVLRALPRDGAPATVAAYGAAVSAWALLTAWPAPCLNQPAFAAIVPPRMRNTIYSFDRAFEGAVAAFATPAVGWAAQRFYGFSGASEVTGDAARDGANADALARALLVFCCVPWAACCAIYGLLHVTYPGDVRRAAAAAAAARLKAGAGGEGDDDGGWGPPAEAELAEGERRALLPGGGGGGSSSSGGGSGGAAG